MSKYFILGTESLSKEEERAFLEKLDGIAWWHWFPNFWLLADKTNALTVGELANRFALANPKKQCMPIEVKSIAWHGRVRMDANGNRMKDWLEKNWDRRPKP